MSSMKKNARRLLLAIPLGIAINAFAFLPNIVNAEPCQDCVAGNRCGSVLIDGFHSCFDSGDGAFCAATDQCPDIQQK